MWLEHPGKCMCRDWPVGLNWGMARKRSRHFLTIAIMGPLTLVGVFYVGHLMRDGKASEFWEEAWIETVASGVLWCLIWFILWISGTFKQIEEDEQPVQPPRL